VTTTTDSLQIASTDKLSLRRWAAVFITYLLILGVPSLWMLGQLGQPWQHLFTQPGMFQETSQQVLKLMLLALYLSICGAFVPLPACWLIAAISTREVGLASNLPTTVLLVATTGALASMMANLNDYHIFTLMLRHRRVAAVRQTRLVSYATRWFGRSPFMLLYLFNLVPVPVDIARPLAATAQYPLTPFAAGNFLGRFTRYALLAAIAYETSISAFGATVVMLGVAIVIVTSRGVVSLFRRAGAPNEPAEPPADA